MDVVNQLLSLRDTCLPTVTNRPAAQVSTDQTTHHSHPPFSYNVASEVRVSDSPLSSCGDQHR